MDDSVSPLDHGNVGMQFFISLAGGVYGEYFQWLDESPNPTGIDSHLSSLNSLVGTPSMAVA